jgi:hypothetical protein
MDIAMIAGGLLVSICQALNSEQVDSVIAVLDKLAERPTMSPAERHIFHLLSDTLNGRGGVVERVPARRPFTVITGGAA